MAVIGIEINEVFRDFIGQFAYTYDKYISKFDINETPVNTFDLINHFKFETIDELNKFLYIEASLEIFGHADQLHDNIMKHFNLFLSEIKDDEEHQIELVSREAQKSIPSTFFFLSKLGCQIDKIRFVQNYEDEWDNIDILIGANPKSLESKPKDKISVKINAPYNKETKADFELDSIIDLFKNESLRDKIFNSKITTYEEIN
jgi:hypothetical protein